MTPGQSRVLVLLIVLASLELLVQPFAKDVVRNAWGAFNNGLNAASQPKGS
jgi:hypothetical protein